MNTVKKGDAFENKVFSVLKELIERDQLSIDKNNYRIFQQKGYYSETRKAEIIFDISIEVYMPGADEFSYLYLVECKDYSSPISVDKVSYFNAQVREVGGHKAFFFTTSKFQSGAVNIAKRHRMGLAIIGDGNDVDWIARRTINNNRFSLSKSEEYFSGESNMDAPFIGYAYPYVYGHIVDFLLGNDIDVTSKGLCVPFIDDDSIAQKALEVAGLEKTNHIFSMSSADMLGIVKKQGVETDFDAELSDGELAKYDVKNNKILISNTLAFDTPRWRFTLAHELGHIILHKNYLSLTR